MFAFFQQLFMLLSYFNNYAIVSPRFGAAGVCYGDQIYLTGGALTTPYVFPPFPETFDHVYKDISQYDLGIY
jgi:hypothetical protein